MSHYLHRAGSLAVVLPLLLAACQTTGNPREGGLLGWSEDKARDRQTGLETDSNAARGNAASEVQQGTALSARQGQLQSEIQSLQARLGRAMAENDELDGEIRKLISKRQLGAADLARLQQTLQASRGARAEAQRAAARAPTPQAAATLSQQTQVVDQYNQQLQREVLLLMRR